MSKTAILAFGRMNPPTAAHELVVNTIAGQNGDPYLYLSHSQDPKKNPLDYETKLKWCKRSFEDKVNVVNSQARNMYEAAAELNKQGYTDLIYVCGSDRAEEAARMRNYNGKADKNGNIIYQFNSINFVTAGGERINEDDLPIEAVSASKQREFAANGDLEDFIKYCPSALDEEEREELYNDVRKGMGLFESLDELHEEEIDEASMKNADISKHDDEYLNAVVNNLGTNGVKLMNGDIKKITNKGILSKLAKLSNIQGDAERAGEFRDLAGFNWTAIDKSPYSGKGGDNGQSAGENAEAAVCYYYNQGSKAKDEVVANRNVNDLWITSSRNSAEAIASMWPRSKYIAVHVNGRDIDNVPEEYKAVAKLFNSKRAAEDVLGLQTGTLDGLYTSGKDTWNKADIVLVKKGSNVISQLKKKHITDAATYNSLLVKMSEMGGPLAPISLKGTAKKPVKDISITAEGFADSEKFDFGEITLLMPVRITEDSNNCTCYLKDSAGIGKIQFRRQSDTEDGLNIEIGYAHARGGKATSRIKAELGLTGNAWYQDFNIKSSKQLMNFINQYFDVENQPNKEVLAWDKKNCEYPWYNRTCFRGIVALYNAYMNKYGDDVNGFYSLVFDCASQGTGAFYLVK